MEDEGMLKKSTVIFIVLIVIFIIGIVIYFITSNNSLNTNDDPKLPSDNVDITEDDKIDESGIYGKFINLDDPNSYFEYNSDGTFTFVMNVCEGYLEYNQDNYNIIKNVKKDDDGFSAEISIKSRSSSEVININFVSELVSATDLVVEYIGPNSCSPTSNYRRI